MFSFLSNFFIKRQIDTFGTLPLDACRILRPYLLERCGITSGNVLVLAVPYFSPACEHPMRNLSAYAVARDYHAYFEDLFASLLEQLRQCFPAYRYAAFYDHSPIAEVEAASRAGLGCIGKNHLLLTEKYSSYVFLAELITDAPLPNTSEEIRYCPDCGRCQTVCPSTTLGDCLSAITQKKGALSPSQARAIRRYATVWGCDLCQESCPYTEKARRRGTLYSPIPYFNENTLPCLTSGTLANMSDAEFALRAYAWRGRAPIERNLWLLEEGNAEERKETPPC